MFFQNRIKSIKNNDRVLEIGPGGTPFWRSNVFLEKKYSNEDEFLAQRGFAPKLETSKPVFFYKGNHFPFKNNEFDYSICSHVLEHVENIDDFLNEIKRVSKAGYIEFPLIYYDFVYNFPEHISLLIYKKGIINWMPKKSSGINNFQKVHDFFYHSLVKEHTCLVDELKEQMFQGFEWSGDIKSKRVKSIDCLIHNKNKLDSLISKRSCSAAEVKEDIKNIEPSPKKLFLTGLENIKRSIELIFR